MSNELHWGGIHGKGFVKAVVPDIWMVFVLMAITYLGLGLAGAMKDTPSFISNSVVAVYPFNKMYTLEASSDALETVSAANEVLNSEMFRTGLKDRLAESAEFSLESQQIDGTFILMLSASGSSPENAYRTLRTALDYFDEISPHLVGDNHLEILAEPDFPSTAVNDSRFLRYRPVLTLFMGFAMAAFLILRYVGRKTYKTASALRKTYKKVRFFKAGEKTMRKTALELLQILRARKAKSILVTSSASDEGKTEVMKALARELEDFGKRVALVESDGQITDDQIELKEAEESADIVLVEGPAWTGSKEDRIRKEATDTSLAVCGQDKADFYAIDRMMTDLGEDDSGFLGCVLYGF